MKTSILAIILSLATTIPVFAKNWYCTDYDQYVSRNFTPLTPDSLKLTFERRGETEKYWKGGADFRLKSGNDSIDQFLAEKVRYLIYEDSLYVNCKDLRCDGVFLGDGYARAYRLEKDKIIVMLDKDDDGGLFVTIAEGIMGTLQPEMAPKTCYVITSDKKIVEKITPDWMYRYLEPYSSNLAQYKKYPKAQQESSRVIIWFLKALRKIYRY